MFKTEWMNGNRREFVASRQTRVKPTIMNWISNKPQCENTKCATVQCECEKLSWC